MFIPALALAAAGWSHAQQDRATVRVRITEAGTGNPLPCRLTLLDAEGQMAAVAPGSVQGCAYRPGVVYAGTGAAEFSLLRGRYTLYANRGLEYGLVTRVVDLRKEDARLDLQLAREVDTRGYVSCDTHIHTLTHSGHGDAALEERMATISGEGIELAVATDHNHHTDYAPTAKATGTAPFFTPVIGNEVTTAAGHFNAFPIQRGSRVPDPKVTDWGELLRQMRATPGVRVVVLNHPSNNHGGFIPTDPRRFHAASGESLDGRPWDFDGIEVVTSAALQSDWMKPFRDWFALLNHGSEMVGIGSSDTHDVDRFILGQGRTYIASTASRADQIQVDAACDSINAGRALISMGLLTEAWVDGNEVGERVTGGGPEMRVRVRVQGPRWIGADRLEIYANGQKIADRALTPSKNAVVKADLTLALPRPRRDAWLVVIASGPGVNAPYWPIPRPYQPTRAEWDPRVIGATNPIRVDGDGDGKYSSPLDYARDVLEEAERTPSRRAPRLMELLASHDGAVAVQAASLCWKRGLMKTDPTLTRASEAAVPHVRHAFVAYRNLLPQ